MMANRLTCIILTATWFGISGCSTQAHQSSEALLEAPSAETRESLEKTIGDFFNSQPVKLADNVFIATSTVFIERAEGGKTMPTIQRGLTPVDSFTLLRQNNHCILRHDQSETLLALPTISCKAD